MQRFHRSDDEKRMVVILDLSEYDNWLTTPLAQAPKFFRQWMGPLDSDEVPLPSKAPRTHSGKVIAPPSPTDEPQPF